MHDIFNHCAPPKISELFTRANQIHSHYTRFSASGNFHVQRSRLNQQLLSFCRIGMRIWNKIPPQLRELHKTLVTGVYLKDGPPNTQIYMFVQLMAMQEKHLLY